MKTTATKIIGNSNPDARQKSRRSLALRSTFDLSLMALPGVTFLLIFNYIPMMGILIAFKNYNNRLGFFGSEWVGFRNFEYLFKSQDAFRIIRNTLGYNLMFIFALMVCAIAVALLMDALIRRVSVKIYQTAFFLPYFISWVVVGYMASILFEYDKGIFNQLIRMTGGEGVLWYQETKPWIFILLGAHLWKNIGFQTVIYYGAIMSIDQELYDAAKIDGCRGHHIIRYIVLPLIKPTAIILTILAIGSIMRADFGLFYYVPNNSGMIYETTDVIDTYIFRVLKQTGDISISSAIGFFQSVVGFVMVMTTNWIVRKINAENALI